MPKAHDHLDSLLHPVRLRIAITLAGREMTPLQIAEALPEVPQATLYRHINRLRKAGVLRVTREVPIRGTTQRVYALVESAASISREEFQEANSEEHLRFFQAFLASLTGLYQAYVLSNQPKQVAQEVVYNLEPLYLTNAEREKLAATLRKATLRHKANTPDQERRRTYVGRILFPESGEAPPQNDSSNEP